jgi:hypothetical protein
METKVAVPCGNAVELTDIRQWINDRKLDLIGYKWVVVNSAQYVSFLFENQGDATIFAMKWLGWKNH